MVDILLVDDDGELIQSLARVLSRLVSPHTLCAAGNAAKALELQQREEPLVAVIDLCLDERIGIESGFELLRRLKAANGDIRVLVLTGHGALEHGIRAMQLGATSFLEKPVAPEHLAALLKDAIAQAKLRLAYAALATKRPRMFSAELIGGSEAVSKLKEEIELIASTNQPVLLLGETGTGKSLAARLIHESGQRRSRKFVHYNPNFGGGDIVRSELYGHLKGSFTGAIDSRRGLVLEANGGTLFIDELDAVPLETQVTFLDLTQEKRIRPIGADAFQSVDCRFIAATNMIPAEALEKGFLRKDLYHRLAHSVVAIPPLRDRLEDLPELIGVILRDVRERESINVFEVSSEVLARCATYNWPGNIRELRGVIESGSYRAHYRGRSVIELGDIRIFGNTQMSGDFGLSGLDTGLNEDLKGASLNEQVESFKRNLVREALVASDGNQLKAASALGIDRGTVRRLMCRD